MYISAGNGLPSLIFNKNTLKISYSCMPNIKSKIESHNSKVIQKNKTDKTKNKECNCRVKSNCPLNGKCLSEGIIYKAIVSVGNNTSTYVGLAGGSFKSRYYNHIKSFNHAKYEKETELSKYVWQQKKKQAKYNIQWEVVTHSNTNKRDSGQCNLCLDEKMEILSMKNKLINKRSEVISACRHNKLKKQKIKGSNPS